MVQFISKKHIRYDELGRDVVLAHISVSSASELPTATSIEGIVLSGGSGAWDVSTGDEYGFANGSWIKQPNGLPNEFFKVV